MPLPAEKTNELSAVEVAERVSILKRFRQLLMEQRDRFHNYLEVLDKQKSVIESGSVDDLTAHVELEERIVADIFSIQKSIEPMRAIYETAWVGKTAPEVPELAEALDRLKTEAARRVSENKELLQTRMSVLRSEIKNLRANPFKMNRRPVYAEGGQASLLDIKG